MKKKTLLIAGSTGLIGHAVAEYLAGERIMRTSRSDFLLPDRDFAKKYGSADVILNFSGSPILKRWTRRNRKEILESRTGTTKKLGSIIKYGPDKARHYLTASAIGIYSGQGMHTEESMKFSGGFVPQLIEKWEAAALEISRGNTRVTILRMGVVLSGEGGIIPSMLPVFRAGLGGRIGNGKQAFSWIHISDLLGAIKHVLNQKQGGVYNLVSPGHCKFIDLVRELSNALGKPAFLAVPRGVLYLLYGRGASVATGGQSVIPGRLLKEDFVFEFPHLKEAIADIVN